MVDPRNNRYVSRSAANMMPQTGNGQTQNSGCRGGCEGNHEMSNSCKALQKRLQELDFSIVETVLYLDAYPDCAEALSYYHKLVGERDALRMNLAQSCHMPVTHDQNASTDHWDWVLGPWPWEAAAN